MVKMEFLRNNIVWYAIYSKFATFSNFEKIKFFWKNPSMFSKKFNFWTFREILLFLFDKLL